MVKHCLNSLFFDDTSCVLYLTNTQICPQTWRAFAIHPRNSQFFCILLLFQTISSQLLYFNWLIVLDSSDLLLFFMCFIWCHLSPQEFNSSAVFILVVGQDADIGSGWNLVTLFPVTFLPRDASAERGDEIACRLSVRPSVRLSVCNDQVPCSNSLEFFENNFTAE